jgi:crotonobetainyl-CoA:carnitine CoA-transferase CaiB-like acyl-CoA transferase
MLMVLATEAIILATAGAYTDMGFNRILMGLNPSFSPLSLGSAYATAMAATSVVAALFSRLRTGRGDSIEVPIIAATMEGLSYNSIVIEGLPDRYKCMREKEIERRAAENIPFDVPYSNLHTFLDPCYRTYKCSDGRDFYVVAPSHNTHVSRFLKLMGVYDELMAEGFPNLSPIELHQHSSKLQKAQVKNLDGSGEEIVDAESPALASVGMYPIAKVWADKISPMLEKSFKTKTAAEWGQLFGEHSIPGTAHRTTHEWVHCVHNELAGLIVQCQDLVYGMMKMPGPLVWMEETGHLMQSPRPRKLVTFDEALSFLQEVVCSDLALPVAVPVGNHTVGWMDGVKILDLTNVIAGPHSSTFLSRFGAEVIKVEPATPTYEPLCASLFTFLTDVGKRKILIDIMSPQGRDILNTLIRDADMVVINAVDRQVKHLGLDAESLQAIHPGVNFCRLDAFGGPIANADARSNYVGYDDVVQSFSGIMSRFGGAATPEEHAHLGTLDVNCGFSGGLAQALALFRKRRTGISSRCRTSLSATSNLIQIKYDFDFEGRGPFDEPSGRDVMGYHPLSHFYETSDGWLFIDSDYSEGEMSKLRQVKGLETIAEVAVQESAIALKEFLCSTFMSNSAVVWADALRAVGIAAAEAVSISRIRNANTNTADGTVGVDKGSFAFFHYADHPGGRPVTRVGHYAIRPQEAKIRHLSPTETHGHSTRQVLKNLKFSDEEVDELIEKKVAATSWGDFLPS